MAATALPPPEPPHEAWRIVKVVSQRVRLRPTGFGDLRGTCPFCRSTAFHVRSSHDTFHCFGCGAGGDPVTFTRYLEKRDL